MTVSQIEPVTGNSRRRTEASDGLFLELSLDNEKCFFVMNEGILMIIFYINFIYFDFPNIDGQILKTNVNVR